MKISNREKKRRAFISKTWAHVILPSVYCPFYEVFYHKPASSMRRVIGNTRIQAIENAMRAAAKIHG